jgi:hypothetical protein
VQPCRLVSFVRSMLMHQHNRRLAQAHSACRHMQSSNNLAAESERCNHDAITAKKTSVDPTASVSNSTAFLSTLLNNCLTLSRWVYDSSCSSSSRSLCGWIVLRIKYVYVVHFAQGRIIIMVCFTSIPECIDEIWQQCNRCNSRYRWQGKLIGLSDCWASASSTSC